MEKSTGGSSGVTLVSTYDRPGFDSRKELLSLGSDSTDSMNM